MTLSLADRNNASRSLERAAAGYFGDVAGERECVRLEPSGNSIVGNPGSLETSAAIGHALALQGVHDGSLMRRETGEAR